jgi:hypothetical protein
MSSISKTFAKNLCKHAVLHNFRVHQPMYYASRWFSMTFVSLFEEIHVQGAIEAFFNDLWNVN